MSGFTNQGQGIRMINPLPQNSAWKCMSSCACMWLHICLEKVGLAYKTTTVEAETYVVVSQNGSCYHFRRFLRSARRYNFTLISSSSLKRRIESLHKSKVLFSFLALLAFKKWYIILRGLRNGAEIILIEKTQTVEHKCNCAFTEKGVVITLKS